MANINVGSGDIVIVRGGILSASCQHRSATPVALFCLSATNYRASGAPLSKQTSAKRRLSLHVIFINGRGDRLII